MHTKKTLSYRVYHLLAPSASPKQRILDWWRRNGAQFQCVASFPASSHEEAEARLQPIGWHQHPTMSITPGVQLRANREGDVLLSVENKAAWMLLAGVWTEIPRPADQPRKACLFQKAITCLSWSPESDRLACSEANGLIHLVRRSHALPISSYGRHRSVVLTTAFAPGGRRIASGASGYDELHIWDVGDGGFEAEGDQILICRDQHDTPLKVGIRQLSWSPDGHTIVTGSENGILRVWDAVTGRRIWTFHGPQQRVQHVCWFNRDRGGVAAAWEDGTIRVWAGERWTDDSDFAFPLLEMQGEPCTALTWSADGRFLLAGVRDLPMLRMMQVFDETDEFLPGPTVFVPLTHIFGPVGVEALSLSPDGRFALAGCRDGTVQVVDIDAATVVSTYYYHTEAVRAVAWSPDGTCIASGGNDGALLLWDSSQFEATADK